MRKCQPLGGKVINEHAEAKDDLSEPLEPEPVPPKTNVGNTDDQPNKGIATPPLSASAKKFLGSNPNISGLNVAASRMIRNNPNILGLNASLAKIMKTDAKAFGLSATIANMVKADPKMFGVSSAAMRMIQSDPKILGLSASVAKMVQADPSIVSMNASLAKVVKTNTDLTSLARGLQVAGLTSNWSKTMNKAGFNNNVAKLVGANYNALGLSASVAKMMEANPSLVGVNVGLAKIVAANSNISNLSANVSKMMSANPNLLGLNASLAQLMKVDPAIASLNANLVKMMEPNLRASEILSTVRLIQSAATEEFGPKVEAIFEAAEALQSDPDGEMVELDLTNPLNRQLFAIFIAVYLACLALESQLVHPDFWDLVGKIDKAAAIGYFAYRFVNREAKDD